MASKLETFNLALGRLRSKLVTDVDPLVDTSPQCAACAREYELVKEAALVSFPWSWATTLRTLSADATAAPGKWTGRYSVPQSSGTTTDRVLAVIEAYHAATLERVEWELYQAKAASTNALWLYADTADDLVVEAIEEVATGVWPETVADLLAWRLAARIAMPLTGNADLEAMCLRNGEIARREAMVPERRHRKQHFTRPVRTAAAYSARLARHGGLAPVIGETP